MQSTSASRSSAAGSPPRPARQTTGPHLSLRCSLLRTHPATPHFPLGLLRGTIEEPRTFSRSALCRGRSLGCRGWFQRRNPAWTATLASPSRTASAIKGTRSVLKICVFCVPRPWRGEQRSGARPPTWLTLSSAPRRGRMEEFRESMTMACCKTRAGGFHATRV